MKIGIGILKQKLLNEINKYENLKHTPGIIDLFIRQAFKESSLFTTLERYESKLYYSQKKINKNTTKKDCTSFGLYQILFSTLKYLGYKGDNPADVDVQVKYAVKYINMLYNRFPEIKNKTERLKFAFASYNCGRGNINKMLRHARNHEEISYNGSDTLQGKWSYWKYSSMYLCSITGNTNASITCSYISYIFHEYEETYKNIYTYINKL